MGEKIRDIHPIKIGKSSLMIELNEGYTASEGRLIHIQNKKFRYLLKENDFYHLSTMVMRAWSEFDYIKNHIVEVKNENDFSIREEVSDLTMQKLHNFAVMLNSDNIDYRILDIQNEMITIIVKEEELSRFKKIIGKKGSVIRSHPFGTNNGYRFLYQMTPFLLYEYDNILFEVYCQLPCASLTPKTWIPLDRSIQKEIWQLTEENDVVKNCNLVCQCIYHLCWAIFFNKGFSPYSRTFLGKNKTIFYTDQMRKLLEVVFFNYTPSLIEQIQSNNFDTIIPNYYSFIGY